MVGTTRVACALTLVFVTGCLALRVDDKQGFALCGGSQLAQLNNVEVTGCDKWPCLIIPGRSGTFKVTFTKHSNATVKSLKTDIYAWVQLKGVGNLSNKIQQMPMPGETRKRACQFTDPRCPVLQGVPTTISKSLRIPSQARMLLSHHGPMIVELKVSDQRGRVVTCFHAPVIVA